MPISGKEMLKKYIKNGWIELRQTGSHVRVKKMKDGRGYFESIPMHKELKKGMEKYLLKRLEEV